MTIVPRSLRKLALSSAFFAPFLFASAQVDAAVDAPAKTSKKAVSSKRSKKKADAPAIESLVNLDVQTFTLSNGMRVYVVEDHSTPAFNINITYNVGSRDEVAGRSGFAHFFEHMMFQGSKNIADNKIGEFTEAAGGNLNAATSFDQTFYYHNLPSQYLDMALWMESDRLGGLEITEQGFEAQRAAVKSERDRAFNNPVMKLFERLLADVFENTPYSHLPIGTMEDLNSANISDVQAFFDIYYRPNNAVMVLVGDVDFTTVKSRVEHYFGPIPKGAPKPPHPTSQMVRGRKIERKIEDAQTKMTLYGFVWPTVAGNHPDKAALDLLGNILFGGSSARLPKILNDEKKIATGTGGGHGFAFVDAGAMILSMQPVGKEDKLEEIKKVVADELAKVAKRGIKKDELEKAINQQLMQTVSALATNSGRASLIANGALFHNDPKRVLTDLGSYRAVTVKDIKRVAKEYLNDNWLFYEFGPKPAPTPAAQPSTVPPQPSANEAAQAKTPAQSK